MEGNNYIDGVAAVINKQEKYLIEEVFYRLIVKYLIPSAVLPCLPSLKDYADDIVKVEKTGNREHAVKRLLNILLREEKTGWYKEFTNALKDKGFSILHHALEGLESNSLQLEQFDKKLHQHWNTLITKVNPIDITFFLMESEAISETDCETILNHQRTESKEYAMITLLHILPKKKPDWFPQLIRALKEGEHVHVAQEIEKSPSNEALQGSSTMSMDWDDAEKEITMYITEEPGNCNLMSANIPDSPGKTDNDDEDSGEKYPESLNNLNQPGNSKDTSKHVAHVKPMERKNKHPLSACGDYIPCKRPRILPPIHALYPENNNHDSHTRSKEVNITNIPEQEYGTPNSSLGCQSSEAHCSEQSTGSQEDKQELKLRDYQNELAASAVSGKNVIVQSPTGTGKTLVALEVAKYHLADMARDPKVFFLVPTQTLVDQQLQQFKKYKELKWYASVGLSGDSMKLQLKDYLDETQIFVSTPQILLNALEPKDIEISQLSPVIFDECHRATKDHPYKQIMALYLEEKLKPNPDLPQIVGLTASVGVGGAKSDETAKEHILKLMANLDADELCTMTDPLNKLQLQTHVNRPGEKTLEVRGRANDPYRIEIEQVMKTIEDKISNAPEVTQAREVQNLKKELLPPSQKGSDTYVQWSSALKKKIARIHDQKIRRVFVACLGYLNAYNQSLLINADCRTKDALAYLENTLKNMAKEFPDETDEWLDFQYREKQSKLKEISKDIISENPKLVIVKQQLLDVFHNRQDSRVIIFVKTREMTSALVSWINEDEELSALNACNLTGARADPSDGRMSQKQQDDVVKYFKDGKHKVVVATSVAEEGLDISKCNLVLRYEHVNNVTSMIQSRGRARNEESQYFVIGEEGKGVAEKERANQIQERMMERAVEKIQRITPEDREKLKLKYQEHIRTERKMKAMGKRTKEQERLAHQQAGDYELRCLKCDELGAFTSDLRVIEGAHHVVLGAEFRDRITTREHPKPTLLGIFSKTGKVLCKKCGYEWGIIAIYKNAMFHMLKISAFVVIDPHDKRDMIKKWKNAPFVIEPLSPEDMIARLNE